MYDINELGKKIKQKRKEQNMTLDDIAAKVKVAKSTIQRYEAAKISTPKIPVVREIAKALGVSSKWLLGKDDILPVDNELSRIPLLGEVAAGQGVWADNTVIDYIADDRVKSGGDYIYLRVCGDSMYPEFHEGDYVLVECTPTVESGSFAVVLVDNENGVVKKINYGENFIELISVNPMYPPRRFEGKETERIRVFGRVAGLRRDF